MIARLLVAFVRLYQLTLSRLILAIFGPVCRFEPSCSHYAVACLRSHGALRGSLLSLRRLSKCHPLHPGGYDPPPPPPPSKATRAHTALPANVHEHEAGAVPEDGPATH
ncbi:MAG: membrane protein insertion efficiency factor YidD [Polyangiaceae bacterium]|nr:membrane protein insertion efficiency factor YidD [Polyangiaceae bacterium]